MIPLISVAATLTLLPGILLTFGPRLDRRRAGRAVAAGAAWSRWSHAVVRRRWPAALAGLAITGALAATALARNPGQPSVDALAADGPAHAGLVTLERAGLGTGTLTPVEALVPAGRADAAAQRLARVDGVRAVLAPDDASWAAAGQRALAVLPRDDAATTAGKDTLDALRELQSDDLRIGGPAAQDRDLTDAIYGSFPRGRRRSRAGPSWWQRQRAAAFRSHRARRSSSTPAMIITSRSTSRSPGTARHSSWTLRLADRGGRHLHADCLDLWLGEVLPWIADTFRRDP